MTKITFLPHEKICPLGLTIDAMPGDNLLSLALAHGIEIEHACDMSCACTTCHVIVRKGYNSLALPEECEEDLLDKAWGLEPDSRLSCQVIVGEDDLEVMIPRYSINQQLEK